MARTLLLGLDSMTFTVLDALVREGRLPFFARCMAEGVRADLLSTPNPLTPPAWTTFMTGVGPGVHGVYDFIRTEERENGPFFMLITAHDVRAETIWSMANRQGRRVISLNFPAMFPPRPIDGLVIPGYITARQLRTSVYPRELYARLKTIPGFNAEECMWSRAENRKAVNGMPPEEFARWIDYVINKDRHWFRITKTLLAEERWDLGAILLEGADRLQHLVWRFIDPDLAPLLKNDWERRVRDHAITYFTHLDAWLTELVELAGPETRVFLVSDHGAGPTREIFYANTWLERHGYLAWKETARPDRDGELSPLELREFYHTIDWSRTRAYARSSSANGIYIRQARPGWGGVSAEDYPAVRARLVDELLRWRDPATDDTVVKRAVVREEAYPGPEMEQAPDITISLRDGGFLSVNASDAIVKPRDEVIGMHRPEGIFLAVGPGIRRGASISPRGIADMTPTLLYSLGLPVPHGIEGKVIEEAFDREHLEREPVRTEGHAESVAATPVPEVAEGEMTEEDEATVLERLRQLGYID